MVRFAANPVIVCLDIGILMLLPDELMDSCDTKMIIFGNFDRASPLSAVLPTKPKLYCSFDGYRLNQTISCYKYKREFGV